MVRVVRLRIRHPSSSCRYDVFEVVALSATPWPGGITRGPLDIRSQNVAISQTHHLLLPPPMDYSSGGIMNSMCSPFFPDLRDGLRQFLVDKTKLIENIVINKHLDGHVDLVVRPRRCGKSTMLQMLK